MTSAKLGDLELWQLPAAPYARYSTTSHDAARAQSDHKRLLDMTRIYTLVQSKGASGATCDEAEQALSMSHQTCSARFSEMSDPLKQLPMRLIQSGERRRTRTGRFANVYITRGDA